MKYLKVLISVSVLAVLAIASCGDTGAEPVISIKTGPTGTITEASEAVFTWTVNDPGESIARYATQKDNGDWVVLDAPATTYTWDNLTAGARKLSIKALNSENGELAMITWSFTYTPQTVDQDRVPGKPTSIMLSPADQQVTVSWTAPTDTGITGGNGTTGVIEKYTVYWGISAGLTKNTTDSEDTANGTTHSLVIDNLINDTPYFFIVTATNDTGESAISAEESATPSAGAVADSEPGAPTILNPDAGDGQVTVNWTAPDDTGITGGNGTTGVIEKYTVYWGTAAGVSIANKTGSEDTADGAASSLVIDNLTNTTTYYFILTAWNDTGESAISSEKSATPTATVIPITGVTITEGPTIYVGMGNTLQLNATVSPSTANQGITWSSGATDIATVDATSGVVTPVKVSSTPVTITATSTADNTKTASIDVTVKEANRAPGAPAFSADAGDGEVTVSWTAPSDLGIIIGDGTPGAITKYTVYWGASANTATGTDVGLVTTYTISGLANGTAIFCYVTAWNATGESTYNTPESITPAAAVVAVDSVTIDNGNTAKVSMDSTLQLTATVLPNNAPDKGIDWSSSDVAIATVDNTGLVTPVSVSASAVTITATSTADNTKTATIAVTVTAAVVYSVGDTGPAGGIIFYVNANSAADGWRYLEAAPSDQGKVSWGGNGLITGDTQTGIGSGEANTANIVATLGGNSAAKLCDELDTGDKNDWFLPSKDELLKLYEQRVAVGNLELSNAPYYWSSSSVSNDKAWLKAFDDNGTDYEAERNVAYWVRAVRTF